MGWPSWLPANAVPDAIAGLVEIAILIAVLRVDFNRPTHRAFALFLALLAVAALDYALVVNPATSRFGWYTTGYITLALPFALAYFGLRLAGNAVPRSLRRVGPGVLLAGLVVVETAYVLNHDLWVRFESSGEITQGPLYASIAAYVAIQGVLAAAMAAQAARAPNTLTSQGFALASMAFMLRPALWGVNWLARLLVGPPPSPVIAGASILFCTIGILAVFAAAWRLNQRANNASSTRPTARAFAALAVTAGLLGFAIRLQTAYGPDLGFSVLGFVDGIIGLVFVGLLTYTLLRYRVFGIDLKVKLTIRRGTLAGVFLATFFIVAQVAEAFAATYIGGFGWVLGAVAAGLLLFALNPLQRWSERLANVALPHVHESEEYARFRRLELYKAALEEMLADGTLSPKDQRVLAGLRKKLTIADSVAANLERDVRAMLGAT